MAKQSICSVDGCGKAHLAKGFCSGHCQRFVKYGSPFGGSTPKGSLLKFVNETAVPSTSNDCIKWPFGTDGHGYGVIAIGGVSQKAHRYICKVVHGEPPTAKHEAAHSCGNGHLGCVNPNHLSWKTHKSNHEDRISHGTSNRGEMNGSSALSRDAVADIRRLKNIKTQSEIAKQFGVSREAISHIHRRTTWAWLDQEGDINDDSSSSHPRSYR